MPARNFWFKLFFLVIFSIVFLSTPKSVLAEWTKYSGNPIVSGTTGLWDSQAALCTSLIFENNIYKMWYTGNSGLGWRIGYATSTDGKQGWLKNTQPVIDTGSPDDWEKDSANPFVIHDNNGYKMWYSSISSNWQVGPDRFRIRYASSPDGINWNEVDWVLQGTPEAWDSGGMDRGLSVIKTEAGYQMWYAGVNEGQMGTSAEKWQIGYATSPNGINWTKYPSNENPQPVISPTEKWELNSVSYPRVIFENGLYHMWYAATSLNLPVKIVYAYSGDGINWTKPADKNPVLTIDPGSSWESVYIASPFVLKIGNTYRMYYDGYNASRWQIGIAEFTGDLPAATPTPTPFPTPASLQPLILLPGLGASWNHRAMILGESIPQAEWYMTPGVKVYDGLIETLKNAGYQTGGPERNLFIFNYNWTKPVSQIAEDLEGYVGAVVNPPDGTKIDLLGHSLGGLVARTYIQNDSDHPIDQLLTLGSPHQGVVQVYYPWEGGNLQQMPAWQRLGIGLLLHLRRPGFSTTKETIQTVAPVLKDLLPTFDYLKQNSTPKPVGEMIEKNDWLMDLNISPPAYLLSALNTFVGNILNSTLSWIKVENRGWLDAVLNLWPDGKPNGETKTADGDETVLVQSGQLGGAGLTELSELDHRDLVESVAGQQAIVDALGLSSSSISTISAGIFYEPALVFQLASPATLTILGPDGNLVGEGDGKLMVVTGAAPGEYRVNVTGTEIGNYQLYIGQLLPTGDFWTTVAGSTTPGQTNTHRISFQPAAPLINPLIDPTGGDYQQSGREKLLALKNFVNAQNFSRTAKRNLLTHLNQIIRLQDKNQLEGAIVLAYNLRSQINLWQTKGRLDKNIASLLKNKLQEAINDLSQAYIFAETAKGGSYNSGLLNREIYLAEKLFQKMESKLKSLESAGRAVPEYGVLYLLALEKLNQAKNSSSYEAHIKTLGCRYLSSEGIMFFKL